MVAFPTDGLNPAPADKFGLPIWSDDHADRLAIDADLEQDHPSRLYDRAVSYLDLQPLLDSYSGRGRKAHRPDVLLRVVLFEMHSGRQSPSQWFDDLRHNTAVRWLARGIRPALSVLYEFHDRVAPFIEAWHQQVVDAISALCPELADTSTLDGTTLEANASRHKMVRLETVEKRLEQLEQAQATAADKPSAQEQPAWMAATSSGRQRQIQRHQKAKERLQEMHEYNAKRPKDKRLLPKQLRLSVVDPEAVSGRDKHNVYRPLYTMQVVWSLAAPVILTFDVFAQAGDHGMLPIMVDRMAQQLDRKPKKLLVDSAYTTPDDLSFCNLHGIDLYGPWQQNDFTKDRPAVKNPVQIPKTQFKYDAERDVYWCPQGHELPFEQYKHQARADGTYQRYKIYRCPAEHCQACPVAATCAKLPDKGRTVQRHPLQELIDQHQERMRTPQAKAEYRQRGQGERAFADLKEHRCLTRVNGRGLQRAKAQAGLAVLATNLQTLDSLGNTRTSRGVCSQPRKIPA
jgi:transposase